MVTRITEAEKQDIATRHTAGESTAEIAAAIDRSERTVRRYLPADEPEPESTSSVNSDGGDGGDPPISDTVAPSDPADEALDEPADEQAGPSDEASSTEPGDDELGDDTQIEEAATVGPDDPTHEAPTRPEPTEPLPFGDRRELGPATVEDEILQMMIPFVGKMAAVIEADEKLAAAFDKFLERSGDDSGRDQFDHRVLDIFRQLVTGIIDGSDGRAELLFYTIGLAISEFAYRHPDRSDDQDRGPKLTTEAPQEPDDQDHEPKLTTEAPQELVDTAYCLVCERPLWQGGPPTDQEFPLDCPGGRQPLSDMPTSPIATCGITVLDLVAQISTPGTEEARGLPLKLDCACGVNLWAGGAPNSSEFPLISPCSQVWVQLDDGSVAAANEHADDNDEIIEGLGCPALKEA